MSEACGEIQVEFEEKSPSQRVWEVDFLRGFLLLFVVFDHLMFNVWCFCSSSKTAFFRWLYGVAINYYNPDATLGALNNLFHNGFVMAFVFLSGVSSNFTSSNLNRAVKLSCFAFLLTAVTSALTQLIYYPMDIVFNVIHVLAVCVFIWCGLSNLIKRAGGRWKTVVVVVVSVVACAIAFVGYYFNAFPASEGFWVVLVNSVNSAKFSPGDYLPLLPALSWFIAGALIGGRLYPSRQSLLKFESKILKPLCWCGKNSLYFYLGSQAVMFVFFYLFSQLLKVL